MSGHKWFRGRGWPRAGLIQKCKRCDLVRIRAGNEIPWRYIIIPGNPDKTLFPSQIPGCEEYQMRRALK